MADAIIPKERADLALVATYEMDTLIDALKREIESDDTSATEYLLPLFLRRMTAINSVAMSVLGDDSRTTEEMREVIHG